MPRGVSVCQQCGASMSTQTRVCPRCGLVRPAPRHLETKRGGDWTISLVNGKQQIAATVSEAVAKRIIGMLF